MKEKLNPIKISVIIPVYSGESFLENLVKELFDIKNEWSTTEIPIELIEAIFVNDSAIDNSAEILNSMQKKHTWIQVVTLSRNFGQHPATAAGILHSCGDWIFTIDEDLQHHPKFFLQLLEHAVKGKFDVVYAKPISLVHQSAIRDYCSRLYKSFLCKSTGNSFISLFNSYRLIRGSIARASSSICSHETYFDIALGWFTNRNSSLLVPLKDQRYILTKKSGYTFLKLFAHARRLMISSPTKILRTIGTIGMLATIVSMGYGLIILIQKIVNPTSIQVTGWASNFLIVLFFGGLTTFLLGVVMEYVASLLLHSQGKPPFFIVDRTLDESISSYFNKEVK